MSRYLITGGTGLIGSKLIESIYNSSDNSHSAEIMVLTRDAARASKKLPSSVRLIESLDRITDSSLIDYVINLAGEPIADRPWTSARKRLLWQSRVDLTNQLVGLIARLKTPPKALISGSAVGWYGDGEDKILDEKSQAHYEYTHSLCDAWEKAALKAEANSVRVCVVRTGIVLSPNGGFLKRLILPFKLGLGAVLGRGDQYLSWIHIDDMVNILQYLVDENDSENTSGVEKESGIFNATAPHPVTNEEFSRSLAKQVNRPIFLRAPQRLVSLGLGEMSRLLTTGQRVIPARLQQNGFEFKFKDLSSALKDVLQ